MDESLEGIADADARLGRPFPLPAAPLPLPAGSTCAPSGAGAEVVWSLDDTRPGSPGRLALYAAPEPPAPRAMAWDAEERVDELAPGTPARCAGRPGRGRAVPAPRARADLVGRRPAPAPDRAGPVGAGKLLTLARSVEATG